MARFFDVKKGDRFKLPKDSDSGLSMIQVELGWKGGDLDASAFLLGDDGVIMNDFDFVFYNSNKRCSLENPWVEEPFDRIKYGNKKRWKEVTRPLSADNSVMGSIDDLGDDLDEDSDDSDETLEVDLAKVDGKIQEIVFVVTVYNREGENGITFKDVISPYIKIINKQTNVEIGQYMLAEKFGSETGVEVGKLVCNIEGEWEFEAVGRGYDGGIQTFVDMYT